MESQILIEEGQTSLEARVLDQHSNTGLLMCHPHPLHGGTMDNKVVTTVTRAARNMGLNTLRFNYRGVGSSGGDMQGSYSASHGEIEDVYAVFEYTKTTLGWERLILAGFSFGAAMACMVAQEKSEQVDGLLLLAPPVPKFDAPSTLPYEFDTSIIMGDADEVVAFDEVEHWVELLTPQPNWIVFEEAGHFFHGRLTDLKTSVAQELSNLIE